MKILLVGDYSGVHHALACGLKELGHEVVIASNGDYWKGYQRDIDLSRDGLLSFLFKLLRGLVKMRGFDVVQIINPVFLEVYKGWMLMAVYKYLRRFNKKVVMLAVGDDYYYSYINRKMKPMRYSDFNLGAEERCTAYAEKSYNFYVGTPIEKLNRFIASDCDAIVAGTYEYWLPYSLTDDVSKDGNKLNQKLHFVPFPYILSEPNKVVSDGKLKVFIGISKQRSEFKGTDIMLRAAEDIKAKYPDKVELKIANGVPFAEYQHMMNTSDVMLDQLYSYAPGMNALLSLSKGMVTFSGGEPEHYDIMGEEECRPIINVEPNYKSVYTQLEQLVLHPERVEALREKSRLYVKRNYDYNKVAKQYEEIYQHL